LIGTQLAEPPVTLDLLLSANVVDEATSVEAWAMHIFEIRGLWINEAANQCRHSSMAADTGNELHY
jgi:hypothetical protein